MSGIYVSRCITYPHTASDYYSQEDGQEDGGLDRIGKIDVKMGGEVFAGDYILKLTIDVLQSKDDDQPTTIPSCDDKFGYYWLH